MKYFLAAVLMFLGGQGAYASPFWSSEAHWDLIQNAFPGSRGDCLLQMKAGSEWVDSLPNQAPSRSFMHAMRSGGDQSIAEARRFMADFIQSHYEQAIDLYGISTESTNSSIDEPFAQYTGDGRLIKNMNDFLRSCYERGVGLHPVMDSTSPAHVDFAIWSISDISDMLKHGDLPNSIENERALFENPDILKRTLALMQMIDQLYMELKLKDFRYE